MRRLVLFAAFPFACMEPSEAARLELDERDEPDAAMPVIPYGERIREPIVEEEPPIEQDEEPPVVAGWPESRGQPRVVVGPWLGARAEDDDSESSAMCPFEVTTRGFPAIRDDGSTIVSALRGVTSASDGEDERMVVRWHDVDRDAITDSIVVFDGNDHMHDWDDVAKRCRPMWRRAKERAAEINAKLDTERWRTLVDVGIHARDEVPEWEMPEEEQEAQPPLPAAERPVELVHVGKQAALRIRGIEVLHRADVDWLGRENWPCMVEPVVYTVLGDRESGALAVFLDHQTGGCLCYPEMELHVLRVPESIFAEAARRPQPQRVPELVRRAGR
jgi:hypothetical protein